MKDSLLPENYEQIPALIDLSKKYVYGDGEVMLTGRTAERTRAVPMRSVRGKTLPPAIIYEITPATLSGPTWKKWVKINELYEIKEE